MTNKKGDKKGQGGHSDPHEERQDQAKRFICLSCDLLTVVSQVRCLRC